MGAFRDPCGRPLLYALVTSSHPWLYIKSEHKRFSFSEDILEYIEDDEEYDMVSDAFDEYLDNVEFDELIDED